MPTLDPFFRWTELDRTTLPEWRERIIDAAESVHETRSYPGYPRWELPAVRPRLWSLLDRVLLRRRCLRRLGETFPSPTVLSRLLRFSHGQTGDGGRGPVPSAGSLQALELYLVTWARPAWLPTGLYHYDRTAHALAQLNASADRTAWRERVPSLDLVEGGAFLWLLVGDGDRVQAKYGARGLRFLLLEAGHLMQNLCLLSTSLGMGTVPLGGYLEREVAQAFSLPVGDSVLYLGLCGPAEAAD